MFAEYRADRRYTKLDPKSKRNHKVGFKLVGCYVRKDGKRLGEKRLTAIDTALTDDLYEKLTEGVPESAPKEMLLAPGLISAQSGFIQFRAPKKAER